MCTVLGEKESLFCLFFGLDFVLTTLERAKTAQDSSKAKHEINRIKR